MTASDVIRMVGTELGGKKMLYGFINELWVNIKEPGVYRGQCASGKDHGFMPIVVRAVLPQNIKNGFLYKGKTE